MLTELAGGMRVTAEISVVGAAGSLLLGAVVAALRGPAAAYVQAFRRIPLAVVCLVVASMGWSGLSYTTLFTLALIVYTGAFAGEAIRAGLATAPRGHTEQAALLGATPGQRARYVIVPQTWKPTVVSVGRVLVTMVKNSALAGSFGVVGDLSQTLDRLAGDHPGSIVAVLLGVCLGYLVITVPLTMVLDRMERGLAGAETWTARPPPPRSSARVRGLSVLVVAGLVYAYLPAPMTDPGDPSFVLFWSRIGDGLRATLTAGVLAILGSLLAGTALAVLLARPTPGRAAAVAVLNLLRGLPVVITILVVSRGFPGLGAPLWYLVAGLTLHNAVAVAEIVRTGLNDLPPSHRDAAYLMGAGPLTTARTILLPQAFRAVWPALTSRLTVVLMDTSLAFVVGYEDLLAVARQANSDLRAPVAVYLVVALIYLALSLGLAVLARRPGGR